MADTTTTEAEALARSAVYRLLSQAFAYPTQESVAQLRDEDLRIALATADQSRGEVLDALEGVAAAVAGADAASMEETYRLLFTHVHSADCPMFETDYGAREIWRQAQELADLAGFYRAFGVEQQAERPDHVAVELEFLHVVSYKAAWATMREEADHARICLDAERAFLADHAMRWVPGFASRLAALTQEGPYRAFAELALAHLRAESARLGLPIDGSAEPRPPEPDGDREIAFCEGES